ncbi:MAG: calcium-binding protein [Nostoc sp. ChiSLP02]|nr:calcium-binding protein [Nostoc sp. DedSLP05]MDZ8102248.1 calcium-binding protein [Nostoc sp. DedSLP01]MDZ8187253.1 calcium-binding protein [Nostoc sp. ChiSLP02]
MPTYTGTNWNDNILGSIYTDNIYGLGGNDTLNPGSGLYDYVDGGAGVDLLVADYSNVSTPYSFSFNNIEKVLFKGSNSADNFTFNNTTDTLYGNGGNDTLNAGAFDDYLNGGSGSDVLYGGDGNDTLNPGSGTNDYIDGGAGVDLLVADYSYTTTPYSFSFTNVEKISFKGSNNADSFTFNNTTDTLYGNGGNDTLNAGAFDDYLDGGSGNDSLLGGTGRDTIYGGNDNDSLFGQGDNDILYGNSGNDLLNGGEGYDFLYGGEGNDILNGRKDNDYLTGGTGADKFVFDSLYDGLDYISDFKYFEGDKIQISKLGFGASSTSQFSYNNSSGALYFDQSPYDGVGAVQFASLQPNLGSGFIPSLDILLV